MPSEYISNVLKLECCCLMGANVAKFVAREEVCDSTIGYADKSQCEELKQLFECDYFHPDIVPYNKGIELCGGLKNIISLGVGLIEGLELGSNTKAMVFRQGLKEIKELSGLLDADMMILESCCIGDLFTSCLSGRNYECGVKMGLKKLNYLEIEKLMNGQKLQGPDSAKHLHNWLIATNTDLSKFPIFTAIYEICFNSKPSEHIVDTLKALKK